MLPWKWDSSPLHAPHTLVGINEEKQMLIFSGRMKKSKMVVVRGNQAFSRDNYHCWTIQLHSLIYGEVMIGVATEHADFTEHWNHRCRLGMDKHSWSISTKGLMCHKSIAVKHKDYEVRLNDHVTVHLDLLNRTLMFAINSRLIGFRYVNLPCDVDLYPVVGVAAEFSELRLVSAYIIQPSLQLLSLVACIMFHCKLQAIQLERRPLKVPNDSSLQWYGLVLLDKSFLPPGLRREFKSLYPWFMEKHDSPRKHRSQHHPALSAGTKYRVPKVIKLADPFESPEIVKPRSPRKLRKDIKRTKCSCGKEKCCKEFNFLRKRDTYYFSSSDDEIFPEIAKRRKKEKKMKKRV